MKFSGMASIDELLKTAEEEGIESPQADSYPNKRDNFLKKVKEMLTELNNLITDADMQHFYTTKVGEDEFLRKAMEHLEKARGEVTMLHQEAISFYQKVNFK